MAGIGFELRRILQSNTYLGSLKAYAYAALISSGPWLMSIVCLAILGLYKNMFLGVQQHEIFRSTVVYIFGGSLIFTGFFQLVVTRFLADQLYVKQHMYTLRTFWTTAFLVMVTGLPLATLFFWFFELSPFYKSCSVLLFLIISLIWLAMVFISSVKDYFDIILAFALGTAGSIAFAILLAQRLGLDGYILGFLIGQSIIFFWLLSRLLAEFPPAPLWDKGLVHYFRKYWDLCLIGAIYNAAIWADKIVFWLAPDARVIVPHFRVHDLYESPVFASYLTIVPTMAIFLIKVETKFYEYYRNYYAKVVERRSYKSILKEKEYLIAMLKEQMREIFVVQGIISGLFIIFAPQIATALNFNMLQVPILRSTSIGSFLQVLLLITIIILFYFDLRKRVLFVSFFYLCTNAGFSYLSLKLGQQFYGYGYCYSCLLSLLIAFVMLSKAIEELEFLTFAKQPVG